MRGLSIDSRYRVVRNLCGRAESTLAASAGVPTLSADWYGSGSSGTNSVVTDTTPVGSRTILRKTWTAVSGKQAIGFRVGSAAGIQAYPVTPGMTYAVLWYQRRSWDDVATGDFRSNLSIRRYDAAGTSLATYVIKSLLAVPAGTWQALSGTWTADAQTAFIQPFSDYYATNSSIVVGSTFDATALMLTEGATLYDYADGNSPSWRWDGTPNASTSRGLVFVP